MVQTRKWKLFIITFTVTLKKCTLLNFFELFRARFSSKFEKKHYTEYMTCTNFNVKEKSCKKILYKITLA
jgi:hypothetical protein